MGFGHPSEQIQRRASVRSRPNAQTDTSFGWDWLSACNLQFELIKSTHIHFMLYSIPPQITNKVYTLIMYLINCFN